MEDHGMPTLEEARRVNEAIVEAHLEANPGAFEAVAFAGDRMQEVLDMAEEAPGACAKAATIMCGTSWAQPFAGANKRTGVALARIALNRSGFDFACPADVGGADRLRRLLYEAQGLRARLDPGAVRGMQIFLWPRLAAHEGGGGFEDAVRRIVGKSAWLFDYMARESPLPAALSPEEKEAEEMARKCTDMGALAERILRARSRHAALLTPEMVGRLIGPRGGRGGGGPTSSTPRAGAA